MLDRFVDDSARSTPFQAYSGVGCDLTARTCNSDVATWPQRNGVPDEVLATVAPSTERVSSRRRRQASLWATLVAMPFNESRRDLSPECDEAESSSVRGYRGPHCPSGHRPRHVLARQKNQMMLEVDASEEAKQVALYRMNSPASCTTTMRSSISSTTTSPRWSRRSATRSPSSARRDDQFHRVGRHVDRKYAATSA